MSTFQARKTQETLVGRKRLPGVTFEDAERKQCSKVVHIDTQKLTGLIASFKEASVGGSIGSFEMWLLQLKLCKEMVLVASGLLKFLEEVADLEELGMDAQSDIIPFIDSMLEECQDLIQNAKDDPMDAWSAVVSRDTKTGLCLDKVQRCMEKALAMVFRSKRWIKTEERFDLLGAGCSLFEAVDDLLKSVTYEGEFLELDSELEALIEDAISKCDDQGLDGYLDVDQDNEEEEEEDEEEDEVDEEDDEDDEDDDEDV